MGGNAALKIATWKNSTGKDYTIRAAVGIMPAQQYDNTTIAKDIFMPVFFETGSNDTVCFPEEVEKAYDDD